MGNTMYGIDISAGTVLTAQTHERLPADTAHKAAMEVYRDFSGDAPIQQHVMEFAAAMKDIYPGDVTSVNTHALRGFDYLTSERIHKDSLRIKGLIAMNMIHVELEDGDLSAELIEPFTGLAILPILYDRWRNPTSVNRFTS